MLSDLIDISDALMICLDCIEAGEVEGQGLLAQTIKKALSVDADSASAIVIVLTDIEIMYDSIEEREEQISNMW